MKHIRPDLIQVTKIDALCNTILSLLFLALLSLFALFVLDLTGNMNLRGMLTFVRVGQQDVRESMPFISAVQETDELLLELVEDNVLTGQSKTSSSPVIMKPLLDPSEYTYFELSNGLRVVLVEKESTQAQVSMNVRVGLWSSGMAPLCQDTILRGGSRKYPSEDYLPNLLTQYEGHSNYKTEIDNTNYDFSVNQENLL